MEEAGWAFDVQSFPVCQNCLRFGVLLLAEGYVAGLYVRELTRTQHSNYDRLDITLFVASVCCLALDLVCALVLAVGISPVGLLCKIAWSLILYLIFLRFVFRREQCAKYFIMSILTLGGYWALSLIFLGVMPLRLSLLAVELGITICAVHQCFFIAELLKHEQERQKELNASLHHRVLRSNEIELLDHRREYEHRVISSEVKYHLYLRRHFCLVMSLTLLIGYYLLWDL